MASTALKNLPDRLLPIVKRVGRYRVLFFVVVVAAVYGFIIWRVNTLDSLQPTEVQVSEQNDPIRTAHVNKTVVNQLTSLQDRSVNVQALFDQARNNPFN